MLAKSCNAVRTYVLLCYELLINWFYACMIVLLCFIVLVNELEKLHHKHGTRPDVFGDSEGEHEIEILTGEITQVKMVQILMV